MRAVVDGVWRDLLDPWRGPHDVRVQVHGWVRLAPLDDLFVRPSPGLGTVLTVARDIGPRAVARKVESRLREARHARRWAVAGVGVTVEGGATAGEPVLFFAPRQLDVCERVVVPRALVAPWEGDLPEPIRVTEISPGDDSWRLFGDWQRESGRSLPPPDVLMRPLHGRLREVDWGSCRKHDPGPPTAVAEFRAHHTRTEGVRAAIFGWGHHARTMVEPNLEGVTVASIHELDPVVLDGVSDANVDTAPVLRPGESWDIVFIAGYHATHGPIAADGLSRGCRVVSEKPLATSIAQLEELLAAWREPSDYFAAFHKRYDEVNTWLREDLAWADGNPMSYTALVHEIALPRGHWYHWPSSGSRIVSNGCHWIDHFLFLNDFCDVRTAAARVRSTGDIVCEMELENDASFTLVLGDRGSDRLGTREHVEIRTADRTATIDDDRYTAESTSGVIRRARRSTVEPHERMYREISRRAAQGFPGDSRRSVEVSTRLVLELEEALR